MLGRFGGKLHRRSRAETPRRISASH